MVGQPRFNVESQMTETTEEKPSSTAPERSQWTECLGVVVMIYLIIVGALSVGTLMHNDEPTRVAAEKLWQQTAHWNRLWQQVDGATHGPFDKWDAPITELAELLKHCPEIAPSDTGSDNTTVETSSATIRLTITLKGQVQDAWWEMYPNRDALVGLESPWTPNPTDGKGGWMDHQNVLKRCLVHYRKNGLNAMLMPPAARPQYQQIVIGHCQLFPLTVSSQPVWSVWIVAWLILGFITTLGFGLSPTKPGELAEEAAMLLLVPLWYIPTRLVTSLTAAQHRRRLREIRHQLPYGREVERLNRALQQADSLPDPTARETYRHELLAQRSTFMSARRVALQKLRHDCAPSQDAIRRQLDILIAEHSLTITEIKTGDLPDE